MDVRWMVLIVGGYLLGSVPFGLVLARLVAGIDPRQEGSGNIGATNVARLTGLKLGVLTLLLDVAKGAVPTMLALNWLDPPRAAVVGLCAFAGHVWPLYLGFNGGKGVATALGVLLAWSQLACLLVVGIFGLAAWAKGYVSLASMLSVASAPVWLLVLDLPSAFVVASVVIALVVVWRHRENIARLRQGLEPSFRKSET